MNSNIITINGIGASTVVGVSGQGSPQINIAGGGWTTSGSISNGQSLQVRLTSSASNSTAFAATVNVGGVTDDFDVTTVGASCSGVSVGGYCWYASASSGDCTSTCSTHGGYNDATRDYVGSAGSDANCEAVLDALGLTLGSSVYSGSWGTGIGCGYDSDPDRWRDTSPATTAGASFTSVIRACACNN